jgi:hypothetical protein
LINESAVATSSKEAVPIAQACRSFIKSAETRRQGYLSASRLMVFAAISNVQRVRCATALVGSPGRPPGSGNNGAASIACRHQRSDPPPDHIPLGCPVSQRPTVVARGAEGCGASAAQSRIIQKYSQGGYSRALAKGSCS